VIDLTPIGGVGEGEPGTSGIDVPSSSPEVIDLAPGRLGFRGELRPVDAPWRTARSGLD
jgi:hypothetical protein